MRERDTPKGLTMCTAFKDKVVPRFLAPWPAAVANWTTLSYTDADRNLIGLSSKYVFPWLWVDYTQQVVDPQPTEAWPLNPTLLPDFLARCATRFGASTEIVIATSLASWRSVAMVVRDAFSELLS